MKPLQKKQTHYITISGRSLPLITNRHATSKRLIVRYDTKTDSVKLTIPRYVSLKEALVFAESKTGWLEKQLLKHEAIAIADGAVLPLWGEEVAITYVGGRGLIRLEAGRLLVPGESEFLKRRVCDFIRKESKLRMQQLAYEMAGRLGVVVRTVTLRETSSRWGSCSSKGNISFCWRLAFAPKAVMDYVVCHEVAHIKHHNHSPSFWNVVAALCPDYETHEAWLSHYGQSLWRYQ